jgi:membrane protein involved in colicin uptake
LTTVFIDDILTASTNILFSIVCEIILFAVVLLLAIVGVHGCGGGGGGGKFCDQTT